MNKPPRSSHTWGVIRNSDFSGRRHTGQVRGVGLGGRDVTDLASTPPFRKWTYLCRVADSTACLSGFDGRGGFLVLQAGPGRQAGEHGRALNNKAPPRARLGLE